MAWQRLNIGSRVKREFHARFWEHAEVKSLRVTRQSRHLRHENPMLALTLIVDVRRTYVSFRRFPPA